MALRAPDEYQTERFVEPSYEDMLIQAIQASLHMQEIEALKEMDAKRLLFSSILQKTTRIGFYDNEIKKLHTILQNVIQEYCEGRIIDRNVKEHILNTIQKIRLTTTELQLIQSVCNLNI
jgi:hypothetical protein